MTTNSTTPAKAGKPKPAAKVSHAKALPPPKVIAEIYLIPIDRIEVNAQVRTIFSEESITDLANDIQERGLRSPVEVTPIDDERYELTLGERRLRAVKHLGQKVIPATIVKTDKSKRLVDQLAENIQREDLEMADQVKAIRDLHDELKSVAAVANAVKKSAGWVSKRLALSHEDLSWEARQLMEDGITEDVEILNCLSSLYKLNYMRGRQLGEAIRAGTATRETARQALKEAKAAKKGATNNDSCLTASERKRIEEERQAEQKQQQNKAEAQAIERRDGTGPEFIEAAMGRLQNECAEPGDKANNATTYLNSLKENQRAAILEHLQHIQAKASAWLPGEWAWCLSPYESEYTYLEQFAAVMAIKGQTIDNLFELVTILEAANMEAE